MINLPEIIIIIVIVMIVFGVGRVQKIGSHLQDAKKEFRKGLDGEKPQAKREMIDITPTDDDAETSYDPKPGTRRDPVEDAEVEPT